MATPFEELIAPTTAQQVLASMLSTLGTLGFAVTSWQADGVAMQILLVIAEAYSDAREAVRLIAQGNFLDLATGTWLTLLAKGVYDLTRLAPTYAEGEATLTAAPTAGPETIAVGQLVAADVNGIRFRNTTGGTLPLGGTLALQWRAELPGTDYNLSNGTLTVLVTSLPGVTVDNTPLSGSWLSTVARDEETDANLRIRCRARWATLGVQAPADAYVAWALESGAGVTRVYVDDQNPGGPGTFWVYCASDAGAATGPQVTTVDNYLQPRKSICSTLTTLPAVEVNVAVSAVIYARATGAPTVLACTQAVERSFRAQRIGGDVIPALAPGRVFPDVIEAAIRAVAPTSIVTIELALPAAPIALANHEVALPTPITISVVQV